MSTSLYGIYLTSSILQSSQATALELAALLLSLIEMPVADSRFRLTDVSGKTLEDSVQCGAGRDFVLHSAYAQFLTSKAPIG